MKLLAEVLKEITPPRSQQLALKKLAAKTLRLAKREARKYKAKPMLVGSLTRNTWLPEKLEFDIFLLFPENFSKKRMEGAGLRIGKKVMQKLKGSFKIEYAEHPYVSGEVQGVKIDLVPCYDLRSLERIKSAVDRTPFHVRYLEKNLKPKLAGEVRLLKKFLEANELYGADAKTQGFSGYACELLILKYKSFLKLLRAALLWKPGEVIDLEKFYKRSEYPKLKGNFKNQVLILLDPTDKNRNTTAALSAQNFFRFKELAQQFLQNPSKEFFVKKEVKPLTEEELLRKLRERGSELLALKFSRPRVVDDVLWPQLRKLARRLEAIFREYGFRVLDSGEYADETAAIAVFELEVGSLPEVQKIVGPIVFDEEGSSNFLQKHKEALTKPYVEGLRWVVLAKRKFTRAKQKLIDTLSEPAHLLEAKGIPGHLAQEIARKFSVLSGSEIVFLFRENRGFACWLRKYFEKC